MVFPHWVAGISLTVAGGLPSNDSCLAQDAFALVIMRGALDVGKTRRIIKYPETFVLQRIVRKVLK